MLGPSESLRGPRPSCPGTNKPARDPPFSTHCLLTPAALGPQPSEVLAARSCTSGLQPGETCETPPTLSLKWRQGLGSGPSPLAVPGLCAAGSMLRRLSSPPPEGAGTLGEVERLTPEKPSPLHGSQGVEEPLLPRGAGGRGMLRGSCLTSSCSGWLRRTQFLPWAGDNGGAKAGTPPGLRC